MGAWGLGGLGASGWRFRGVRAFPAGVARLHMRPNTLEGHDPVPPSDSGPASLSPSPGSSSGRRSRRLSSRLVFVGGCRRSRRCRRCGVQTPGGPGAGGDEPEDGSLSLGWGEGVGRPEHAIVRTPDGAELALWDLEGDHPDVRPGWCSPTAGAVATRSGCPWPAGFGPRASVWCSTTNEATGRARGEPHPWRLRRWRTTWRRCRRDRRARRGAGGALNGRHDRHVARHLSTGRSPGAGQGDGAGFDRRHPVARWSTPGRRVATALVASPFVSRDAIEERTSPRPYCIRRDPVRADVDLTRNLFGDCHGTVRGGLLDLDVQHGPSGGRGDDRRPDHGDGRDA